MTNAAPTPAQITNQIATLSRERARYWIGGVPTHGDTKALIRDTAHALKIGKEAVEAALAETSKGENQ